MFRIVKSPRAWWPVTWTGVTEAGEVVENRIELRFQILKVDAFVELMREAQALSDDVDGSPDEQDAFRRIATLVREGYPTIDPAALLAKVVELVKAGAGTNAKPATEALVEATSVAFAKVVARIATDWRGVAAENGEALSWSSENLALLMNEPRVFDRTMVAFREVTAGQVAIREGN